LLYWKKPTGRFINFKIGDSMKLKEKIIREIEYLVENSSLNKNHRYGFSYFKSQMVGFASINNPLFSEYKNIIGVLHYHPREFFDPPFADGLGTYSLNDGFITKRGIAHRLRPVPDCRAVRK
jgi:hypothetical protein